MARYFMNLAYLGRNFHGWQRQPNAISVQEKLETALSTVTRTEVAVTGAGRTDAGVNASTMIAHFDLPEANADEVKLVRAINAIIGPDIALQWIRKVHHDAHARFDATSRTYHYYAHTDRNPFAGGLSWQAPATLDFEAMNHAAAILMEISDFTSFAKLHTDAKTNICNVTTARWRRPMPGERVPGAATWIFEITADRFLRNMVRAIVGTLVDVGRGKIDEKEFREIIERKDRCAAGTSMPGEPLFLHNITYPYIK
ncbi:MAG: tRNA pseudouridine(38-40) synthase TruA [Bacteroidales bacterium]|nr:tRNA pseudouridine(38-40) synthase TruA [Bacteroidales bacterium]